MSIGRAVDVGLSGYPVISISGRRWRRAAVVLVAAMLPAGVSALGQALPSNCAPGSTVICKFFYTGAPDQIFEVPAGISSVNVVAVGAPGGASGPRFASPPLNPNPGPPGGAGAVASATLPTRGGFIFYVEVGGPGGNGYEGSAPGFNGGGAGDPSNNGNTGSGGGGGASDVRSAPYSAGVSPDSDPRWLVAGGGGGSGAPSFQTFAGDSWYDLGGAGGAAGGQGGDGNLIWCANPPAAGAGRPGTASSGGVGGTGQQLSGCNPGEQYPTAQSGGNGTLGQGGGGSTTRGVGGGGGGGGLYGGGQGGEALFNETENLWLGSGAGGGGGSSRVPQGGSVTANTTGLPPQVTISYAAPGVSGRR